MTKCNVCESTIKKSFYKSHGETSITSMGEICNQNLVIYRCDNCSHVQTNPLENIEEYYDQSYKILINSDEEDQIYMDKSGNKTFRIDHQVDTLLKKIKVPEHAKVLDYGSGKGATLRKLVEKNDSIIPHLFDVSNDYKTFWKKFAEPGNCATYKLSHEWSERFDLVLSFFALEHVENPIEFVKDIYSVLNNDGCFYGIVPNMYDNIGDFAVIDHVNHFSENSLNYLFQENGFSDISIDSESHYGAYIVCAKKTKKSSRKTIAHIKNNDTYISLSDKIRVFWSDIDQAILNFENRNSDEPKAIYGSGFYGAYIAAKLKRMDTVKCFLDQNPHRQGLSFFNKPVLPIDKLPSEVKSILVGLNPETAKRSISHIEHLLGNRKKFFFLKND